MQAMPALDRPLVQIYGELKSMAAEGNMAAACRIGYELMRCRNLPATRSTPDFLRQNLATLRQREGADADRQLREAEARVASAEAACRDFPEEEFARAWDYYLAAALAGNRHAVWRVLSFPPGLDASRPESTLEGWAEWRRYQVQLIEIGIRDGDPRVFDLASQLHDRPYLRVRALPLDPVRSLAYKMALLPGASAAYRPVIERELKGFEDHLDLTPQQVEQARVFAASLPALRGLPKGGFDWTRGPQPETAKECERP